MNNYIKSMIENAGWYEGRSIDIDYMIEELEREGYKIKNNHVIQLLKEFWNLNIEFITPSGRNSNVRLNIEAALEVEKRDIDKISEILKEELIPVGFIHEDTAILLVSSSGKFYMAANRTIFRIGKDFFEALDTVFFVFCFFSV
ncbi:MAG: SUKH-3 domain-containing protein [Bacteroidetes bacterium]|nr:SUKH-3 domain-containing protein [Bacteroidota bacterium]